MDPPRASSGRLVGNISPGESLSVYLHRTGLLIGDGSAANLRSQRQCSARPAAALIPVMFTYSLERCRVLAERFAVPNAVPLALALGTSAVVAIYVLLNLRISTCCGGPARRSERQCARRIADASGTRAGDVLAWCRSSASRQHFRDGLCRHWSTTRWRETDLLVPRDRSSSLPHAAISIVAQGVWRPSFSPQRSN